MSFRPNNTPASGAGPRRWPRWLWLSAVGAAALLPKCLLCVAGYIAVATGLGMATPELCGPVGTARLPVWATAGVGIGVLAGIACLTLGKRRKMSGTARDIR